MNWINLQKSLLRKLTILEGNTKRLHRPCRIPNLQLSTTTGFLSCSSQSTMEGTHGHFLLLWCIWCCFVANTARCKYSQIDYQRTTYGLKISIQLSWTKFCPTMAVILDQRAPIDFCDVSKLFAITYQSSPRFNRDPLIADSVANFLYTSKTFESIALGYRFF